MVILVLLLSVCLLLTICDPLNFELAFVYFRLHVV